MSETKSVKKQWITTIVVLVLICGTAFASVTIIKKAKEKKAAGAGGGWGKGAGGAVTAVSTVKAEALILKDFVLTNGEDETQVSVDVFPYIGGKVVQMKVSLGSSVNKGDVIAYIDPSEAGSY